MKASNYFSEIAGIIGGRDHTTVMHAYEKIKNSVEKNQTISDEINQLRNMLAV
jgi:chromosomal replication initiation ATPase DnaA